MARLARGLPQKQDGIKIVTRAPSSADGKAGDMRLLASSSVEGVVLYVKSGNKWFPFQSGIDSKISSRIRPDYDSGWFLVALDSVYDKTFGWNVSADTLPRNVKILWSDAATPVLGTDEIWEVQTGQYFGSAGGMGAYIEYYSNKVIRLHTGDDYTFYTAADMIGGTGANSTAGYYKLQVWK